ncbi:MAG: hypothetical protein PHX87_00865 [Candidatus Peribacteraceae bacterium]|nr:hypothetical protein [Candidatus Peribacteraceae bacterium]MDD5741960.1 hypothetical protein [Candidatus Peribacteraceae bacterium]
MKTSSVSTTVALVSTQGAIVLPVIAFAIPFFVSGPQWLTGTAVNCLLVLAAARLPGRHVWSVILLPSVGAVAHGMLFGPFTSFLLFFVPFIWAGNWLFTAVFLRLRDISAILAVSAGALAKAATLALFALVFFRMNLVPQLFVESMSLIQFFTAIAGGLLALGILRFLQTTHE